MHRTTHIQTQLNTHCNKKPHTKKTPPLTTKRKIKLNKNTQKKTSTRKKKQQEETKTKHEQQANHKKKKKTKKNKHNKKKTKKKKSHKARKVQKVRTVKKFVKVFQGPHGHDNAKKRSTQGPGGQYGPCAHQGVIIELVECSRPHITLCHLFLLKPLKTLRDQTK